jgi:ribosomal-protein-alanine N-acetyltransferase
VLETERLVLRRWRPDDRGPFAAMNADPEVMEYLGPLLTRDESDALVERIEAQFDELGYGLWAVQVRETGVFIGFTGLALQTFPAHFTPAVEVGWRLARPAWGHGYASEAARAAVTYGFHAGLDEIVSITSTTNLRSQRVMQRIGMTRDPDDDFVHPNRPPGDALAPHVLYRIRRPA